MSGGNTNFTTSSSQPKKSTGQFHSTKGSIVETVGNLTGASSMQRKGYEEHAAGQTEINAAKAKGYAEGTADRVTGKKDSVVGALTGDNNQQMRGNARNEKGNAKQSVNN